MLACSLCLPDSPVPLQGESDCHIDCAAQKDVSQRIEGVTVQRVEQEALGVKVSSVSLQESQKEEAVVEDHQAGQQAVEDVLHVLSEMENIKCDHLLRFGSPACTKVIS